MLTLNSKIQIEGLRTYLFTNSAHYVSLSLSHLSEAFSLPVRTITSIVSRMIYKDELQASLDAIDQVIVFKTVEQTEIQRLSLQLADRVNALVEQNERALDQKLNQGQPSDRNKGDASGGDGNRGERRGGTRGESMRIPPSHHGDNADLFRTRRTWTRTRVPGWCYGSEKSGSIDGFSHTVDHCACNYIGYTFALRFCSGVCRSLHIAT